MSLFVTAATLERPFRGLPGVVASRWLLRRPEMMI
jgi:hypothetical protein